MVSFSTAQIIKTEVSASYLLILSLNKRTEKTEVWEPYLFIQKYMKILKTHLNSYHWRQKSESTIKEFKLETQAVKKLRLVKDIDFEVHHH